MEAPQERLRKINRKREVEEFKSLDKKMVSGNITKALRCLSDATKGVALSTFDKMIIDWGNFTVPDLLQEHMDKKLVLKCRPQSEENGRRRSIFLF